MTLLNHVRTQVRLYILLFFNLTYFDISKVQLQRAHLKTVWFASSYIPFIYHIYNKKKRSTIKFETSLN